MNAIVQSPATRPQDMAQSRQWTVAFAASPERLPFSFVYGGRSIHGLPAAWHPTYRVSRIDANVTQTMYEGADDATGLHVRVEWLEYRDFPVVEWTVWLTNRGAAPTPLLRDIRGLDAGFAGGAPVLYHCNGDFCSELGYTPQETPLAEGAELTSAPDGGRPCDGAFPYFRVQFDDCGLTLAIGWPGQWSGRFTGTADGVAVQAGQELTNLSLRPGETIRTPRITIMSWVGDATRAVNLWRRWYRAHVLPRPDGQALQPLLALAATDTGEEFTAATEENQLRYLDRFHEVGLNCDIWWIDAGWYPCRDEEGNRRWPLTGTWVPDPERFHKGFAPVSQRVRERGGRLLVWFEPERVTRGSQLWREHPEWLLHSDATEGREARDALLNLGDHECRRWLTDHVCAIIQEGGVGVYRQDFNFRPLRYWRDREPEDRQGMNENLHVQGYLQYWDDLLERNPGLWIDSCSSGGRRNDLETMRRSVPLHYTDYGYGIHPVKLSFHQTLFAWIPYFKESTLAWDLEPEGDRRFDQTVDPFSYHCGMAAMMFVTCDIRRDDYDFALARRLVELWRRAAPFMLEADYYPLTPFSRSGDDWVAWQFDCPEVGRGLLQGFRHAASAQDQLSVSLQGIDPGAQYLFENPETGEQLTLAGSALVAGFVLSLPPRSAALWFYRRQ